MILGRVISRVVSSAKLKSIPARPLLTVVPLEGYGDPRLPLLALDAVQAGPGDIVLVVQEGTGARQTIWPLVGVDPKEPLPAQAAIVGIVESMD